ncbi:dipeptidase [Paenibacillus hexagrammi]|uniref:Dipeptidase n=1 Tax=Paenibacillus hexagrammi TaxID=2908839 RepID=A0ABY3SR17_9BACL|nr:dipeptidase [Paenibacillus sp. YPD9-1]UJF35412.1 dipeptidase [Paenibacillus sp. YPD9-1]
MKIIDGHCDAITKLFASPELDFFQEEKELDVSYPRLQRAGVKIQAFAMYMSESIKNPTFDHLLQMVDIFYRKIAVAPHIRLIRNRNDVLQVEASNEIGALLTLEGLDALHGNLTHLRVLQYLGVRSIGLTWNYANWAADGVMEPRKGGFTLKGKMLLKELEKMDIITDVSHLSVKGFWELAENYSKPCIASHSNVFKHCAHPRNLSDDQILELIRRNGLIGLTFVPFFVDDRSPVTINQLLKHLDHVCALGGEQHVGFGSDFDGIEQWITGLEHAGLYDNIINALSKTYTESQVERFLYGNWRNFLLSNLPEGM